jgi:hypothetical protein
MAEMREIRAAARVASVDVAVLAAVGRGLAALPVMGTGICRGRSAFPAPGLRISSDGRS